MKQKAEQKNKSNTIEYLNNFLRQNEKALLFISLGLSVLFGLLLFNLRISEGGDDSTYIIRAYDLIKEGKYPSYQGPLYPMFLSVIIALTGIKIGILKFTSLLFMAAFFILFHRAFRQRVEPIVLYPVLLFLSVNSYLLYFASQTYSEAMFLAELAGFFLVFFKHIDHEDKSLKDSRKALMIIATGALILTLTRTIGLGVVIAVTLYFVLNKEYKKAGIFIAFFIAFLGIWLMLKGAVWGFESSQGSSQATSLIYKNPYDFSQGKETFTGYLGRFVDNSNLYISKHFLKILGFRSANSIKYNSLYTVIFYLFFIFTFITIFKKNRYLLFTGIFIIVFTGITFISLQKIWDQYRLIIPIVPFTAVFLFSGLVELFRKKQFVRFGFIVPVLFSLTIILSAGQSFKKIDLMTLRSNINGNKFKGYTDDWANYLKMAEYVGEHLDKNSFVACRKPNMARLYAGGKKFYGIYRFNTTNPDSLLNRLKKRHVTHIIMANLRKNPRVNNGLTINTVKRYMAYIVQKYPKTFILQYKTGKSEPAYLFRIDYSRKKK
ncbi:MAG: hypothetical protein GXO47_02710 [Chlorobi bacterium]|nr:hypothetical protein [Chlorobiota bacterium]